MILSAKDIYDTIHSLHIEGRRTEELEALLVHEDDFVNLINSISSEQKYETTITQDATDKISIYGVEVIESRHVQPGSIFKIFKDDTKNTIPESLKLSTVIDKKKTEKRHSKTRKIELG